MEELNKVEEMVTFAESVLNYTELSIDDLRWLFYYLCVKDENGRWQGLSYGNHYSVVFEDENIYIKIVDVPLYFETKRPGEWSVGDRPTPFKDKYYIKCGGWIKDKVDLGKSVIIPKYTGYEDVLNGEAEDISVLDDATLGE